MTDSSVLREMPSPDSDPREWARRVLRDHEVAKLLPDGVIRMSRVEPVEVSWLWYPYIPRGKMVLLEGDPGCGKSWLSLAIATGVSRGTGLPGRSPGLPGTVLLLTAEDGLDDTVRPRLDLMGADPERVYAFESVDPFDATGLAAFESVVLDLAPDLVIVDPLVAYLGPGVDMHRANETRAVLSQLAALADESRAAILAIRHLNKGAGKALYRGLGSIDFTAAVRSVMLAGREPEDPTKGAVLHIKSNLAPFGDGLSYRLSPEDGFMWTGTTEITPDQLLGSPTSDEVSAGTEAGDWLLSVLEAGPLSASDIERLARKDGIWGESGRTLKRAKSRLGVESRRTGFGSSGNWTWLLPGTPKDATNPIEGLEDV